MLQGVTGYGNVYSLRGKKKKDETTDLTDPEKTSFNESLSFFV